MKVLVSSTASAEWNAAYYRLEDYLRALHVVNKVYQSQIILRVLERAAAKHAANPEINPTTVAMNEVWGEMETWFDTVLPTPPHFLAAGPVSLLVTDATEKWPTVFLSADIPPEFTDALKACEIQAGPDLNLSSMVPRPLDTGPAEETSVLEKTKRMAMLLPMVLFGSAAAAVIFLLAR